MGNLEYVLVRTEKAGVHFGFLEYEEARDGGYYVTLVNTRRVWSWSGANSLSDLALKGSKNPEQCKITAAIQRNKMFAIEIMRVHKESIDNINAIKDWTF